jgi:predicted nuclease with TOPRIM domain
MAAKGVDQLGKKALWAEPHLDEAADWMKKLADDIGLRQRIGLQAMKDAKAYHEIAKRIEFMDELKAILKEKAFLLGRQQDKKADLSALRQAQQEFNFSGWAGMKRRIEALLNKHLLWRFKKT